MLTGLTVSRSAQLGEEWSEEEKAVLSEALMHNVWAAALVSGAVDEAIAGLVALLPRVGSSKPLLYTTLAAAFERSGRFAEAASAARACRASAGGGALRSGVGFCLERLARVLSRQGRMEEALVVLGQAGEGADAGTRALKSMLLMREGGRSEEAVEEAMSAAALRPVCGADIITHTLHYLDNLHTLDP